MKTLRPPIRAPVNRGRLFTGKQRVKKILAPAWEVTMLRLGLDPSGDTNHRKAERRASELVDQAQHRHHPLDAVYLGH